MDQNDYQRRLDEYRELGLEYRYKDQMMVQELGFIVLILGIVANGLLSAERTWVYLFVQIAIGFFVVVLARHLDHTNQDRRATLGRKEELRIDLGFQANHLGAGGKRLSAPRTMVWLAMWLVPAWWTWCVFTLSKLLCE